MSKLSRRLKRQTDSSRSVIPPCFFGINGGLFSINMILPLLIICLLVLSALLISGCSKGDSVDKQDKKSTSSMDKDSKDTGDENNLDEKDGEERTAPTDSSSQSQEELVRQTALSYAKQMNPAIPDLNVVSVKIIDQWGCVDVEPADRSADKARVLLKNSEGQWQVIAFGYVLPQDHPDVPAELFE